MIVYFIVSALMIGVSVIVFWEHLVIGGFSLVPVALILVSLLQAMIFRSYVNEKDENLDINNTVYTLHEVDRAAYRLGMKWHYICKMVIIPPLVLLTVHFSSLYKFIFSILLYLFSYLPVKFLVRWEQKK